MASKPISSYSSSFTVGDHSYASASSSTHPFAVYSSSTESFSGHFLYWSRPQTPDSLREPKGPLHINLQLLPSQASGSANCRNVFDLHPGHICRGPVIIQNQSYVSLRSAAEDLVARVLIRNLVPLPRSSSQRPFLPFMASIARRREEKVQQRLM